jgi:hypothetical protein
MSDGCDLSLIGLSEHDYDHEHDQEKSHRFFFVVVLVVVLDFLSPPGGPSTTTTTSTIEDSRCLLPSSRRGCRISPGSMLEPRHRLEAYATLILGRVERLLKGLWPRVNHEPTTA